MKTRTIPVMISRNPAPSDSDRDTRQGHQRDPKFRRMPRYVPFSPVSCVPPRTTATTDKSVYCVTVCRNTYRPQKGGRAAPQKAYIMPAHTYVMRTMLTDPNAVRTAASLVTSEEELLFTYFVLRNGKVNKKRTRWQRRPATAEIQRSAPHRAARMRGEGGSRTKRNEQCELKRGNGKGRRERGDLHPPDARPQKPNNAPDWSATSVSTIRESEPRRTPLPSTAPMDIMAPRERWNPPAGRYHNCTVRQRLWPGCSDRGRFRCY